MKNGLSPSHEKIIDKLAESYGIEPEYEDTWGRVHRISLGTKRSILKGLGADVDTETQATETWHARQTGLSSHITEPSIVTSLSCLPNDLSFQIPRNIQGDLAVPQTGDIKVSLEVTDEEGRAKRFAFSTEDLTFCETRRVGNRVYELWHLPFPQLHTLGYYRFDLSVQMEGRQWVQSVRVAICPEKAYIPSALEGEGRVAGIAINLYGVRSERNWGIGDLGDLKAILTWAAEDLHVSFVGLNPLHATFNRRPFNISPYLPLSRFYRNFIYLDVPAMEDYQSSSEAQDIVNTAETQRLLSELRGSETVEYEKVAALKIRVLRKVFQTFLRNHWKEEQHESDRRKALQSYIKKEGPLLENFATFCAIDSTQRSRDPDTWTWTQWPREYQRPDTKAVRQFQQKHWEEILFYKFVQWQLEKQLDEVQGHAGRLGMCIGLYHDLALGVDRFSADFWAYRDFFFSKLTMGAPPDAFSQHGQDWGLPPPDMEKLRETGYELFVKEIQKNCAFGGALRLDHVMRFFHLYCIPEGGPPDSGAYVSQPFEDLLRIVKLESVRNRVIIVGEDLGTVPGYIRDILAEENIFSYRLLYFEKDDKQNFILSEEYPELAVVTVTTHDLPTLAGFWTHRDIQFREGAGIFESREAVIMASEERETDKQKLLVLLQRARLLPEDFDGNAKAYPEVTGEIHNAVVGFLAMTPAKLFLLSQEDLFKETDQQNLPGTTQEYPNWSVKMRYTVEELRSDAKAKTYCDMFRTAISESDRDGRTAGGEICQRKEVKPTPF